MDRRQFPPPSSARDCGTRPETACAIRVDVSTDATEAP